MANIVLKTYAAGENNQGSVTPQNDALIYQSAIPMNGIFSGAVITISSANRYRLSSKIRSPWHRSMLSISDCRASSTCRVPIAT